MGADAAKERIGAGAREVVVAVIDTGIDSRHADLQDYLLPPLSVLADTRDDDDHGTMVAGMIVSAMRGGPGRRKLRILPVKFASQSVIPCAALGAKAIYKALDAVPKPHVLVLAWDVGCKSTTLDDAIAEAGKQDVVVVAAAGNHALDIDRHKNWPGSYGTLEHVVTAMASDDDDERASFSCYGAHGVNVAALGTGLVTTVPYAHRNRMSNRVDTRHRELRGTSAAAAQVAGLAALLRMQNPGWSAKDVKEALCSSADRDGKLRARWNAGMTHYGRALRGPFEIDSPAVDGRVPKGSTIDLRWRSLYRGDAFETVDVVLIDRTGVRNVLAHDVPNTGEAQIELPSGVMRRARLSIEVPQTKFSAETAPFDID